MRELNAIYGLPDDVVYKEVVVIGNGPSGICTSYQLAGHWPVLRQDATSHPEAMLEARLKDSPAGRPLPLQPLNDLAGDLEGRSQNPIPLLVDCLTNPGADMGMDLPSMLEWKYFPEKKIDHVVLGRGKAGGLWHTLDSSVVTLSPSRWMALPGQPNLPGLQPHQRAPVSAVATYYQQYVKQFGLQKFFRNNTMVTSIKPIKWSAKLGSPIENASMAWCVCGYDSAKKESFRYVCSRVILATGASDRPNAIKENGKTLPIYGAIRTSPSFQTALDALSLEAEEGKKCLPILVIGSGLSAADAILRARARGLPVAHAYRSPSAALRSLPPSLYPEYHQVHQMMKDGVNGKHILYTALPDHITIDDSHNEKAVSQYDEEDLQNVITPKTVQLLNTRTNKLVSLEISFCVILIGSKPDLHFLPEDFNTSFLTFDMDNESLKPDILGKSNARKMAAFNTDVDKQPNRTFPHPTDLCIKCSYNARNFQDRLVFFKTQWHNLKCIVGNGLQKTKQDIKTIKDKCEVAEIVNSKESLNGHYQEIDNDKNNLNKAYSDFQGTGIGLGIHPNKPIDSRTNPFFIDRASHELQNAPKGMYALGPLAGDNFVRFIPGGALAIVSSIWNERKSDNDDQSCSV